MIIHQYSNSMCSLFLELKKQISSALLMVFTKALSHILHVHVNIECLNEPATLYETVTDNFIVKRAYCVLS